MAPFADHHAGFGQKEGIYMYCTLSMWSNRLAAQAQDHIGVKLFDVTDRRFLTQKEVLGRLRHLRNKRHQRSYLDEAKGSLGAAVYKNHCTINRPV